MPTSGRRIGSLVAAEMTAMFSSVCDATWPTDFAGDQRARAAHARDRSAMRIISRR